MVLDMALWQREPFSSYSITIPSMQSGWTPNHVSTTCMVVFKTGKNFCPQDQILVDLTEQIALWQTEGNTVIILADINKDIREEPIHLMFQQMGLIETIITQHGTHGPNTHNCGTNPINGIFIPSTLIQDVTSGYLAFGEGIPSNHRAVWIDLPLVALGWFNIPESVPLQARRLKCNDPRIIQWYNKALQEKLNQHQLAHCIKTLTQQV